MSERFLQARLHRKILFTIAPGGGGGYSHILAIRVCDAGECMVFKLFGLVKGMVFKPFGLVKDMVFKPFGLVEGIVFKPFGLV